MREMRPKANQSDTKNRLFAGEKPAQTKLIVH